MQLHERRGRWEGGGRGGGGRSVGRAVKSAFDGIVRSVQLTMHHHKEHPKLVKG
jgi:hypothetical protein